MQSGNWNHSRVALIELNKVSLLLTTLRLKIMYCQVIKLADTEFDGCKAETSIRR